MREHIAFLCNQPTSIAAFPTGRVPRARIERFLQQQHNPDDPDLGCTAEECCPELTGKPLSAWNQTFIDCVTADFLARTAEGLYGEYNFPPDALTEKEISERVKVCLYSMHKAARQKRKLNTAEKVLAHAARNKYMERRRVVSHPQFS
jgi:hypothetical protein